MTIFHIRMLLTGIGAVVIGVLLFVLKNTADDLFETPLFPFDAFLAIIIGIGLTIWTLRDLTKKS